MAKPWENYKAKQAAREKKAADRALGEQKAKWAKEAGVQQQLPLPGPYPQHAKLYPHTQTNWEIREFWHFLATQGLSPLSWDELDDQLLRWRGVDKEQYRAEAADMRVKYRWLWEQYEPRLPELAAVIDETRRPERLAMPELGKPLSHMPPLKPEITKEDEKAEPEMDPATILMNKLRGVGK